MKTLLLSVLLVTSINVYADELVPPVNDNSNGTIVSNTQDTYQTGGTSVTQTTVNPDGSPAPEFTNSNPQSE